MDSYTWHPLLVGYEKTQSVRDDRQIQLVVVAKFLIILEAHMNIYTHHQNEDS